MKTRSFKYLSIILMLCVFAPFWAAAQNSSGDHVKRLKTTFQTLLEQRQNELAEKSKNQRALVLDGDVTVESTQSSGGEYYAITLPHISLHHTNGKKTDIGLVALNATPHTSADSYKMTIALPSSISSYNAAGTETMRTLIGQQNTAGLWNTNLNAFTKLDALYNDIRITNPNRAGVSTTFPVLRIRTDLTQDENLYWTGPSSLTASNITVNGTNGEVSNLEGLSVNGNIEGYNPEASSPLQTAKTADIEIALAKFKSTAAKSISFDALRLNAKAQDLHTSSSDFEIAFNVQNLDQRDGDEDVKSLLPRHINLNITQKNIPGQSIADALSNANKGGHELLKLSLLLKLPALLSQAGSQFEIRDTRITNDEYNITLNAVALADITAANSATAKGSLRFVGLDKTLARLQVDSSDILGKHSPILRNVARILERMKPFARIETTADDGYVHIFDFEMNAVGQFLINGQNAAGLLSNQALDIKPVDAAR